jgi:hypothetical protein
MKLSNALNSVMSIANASVVLWPLVRGLTGTAEGTFPGTKRGAEKLDAVMAGVEAATQVESTLAEALKGIPPAQISHTVQVLAARAVAKDLNGQPTTLAAISAGPAPVPAKAAATKKK